MVASQQATGRGHKPTAQQYQMNVEVEDILMSVFSDDYQSSRTVRMEYLLHYPAALVSRTVAWLSNYGYIERVGHSRDAAYRLTERGHLHPARRSKAEMHKRIKAARAAAQALTPQ